MRFAGNVIWFVFCGAILALTWLLGACVFAVTIIGLPLTRSAIEMAKLAAWPFGKEIVHIRDLDNKGITAVTATTGTIGLAFNILWLLTFGWVLFLQHLIAGIFMCLTIIGIPFGLQSFKLAAISFWPVGRRVITKELAQHARYSTAEKDLGKYRR